MGVYLYRRFSTDEQEKGDSLARQSRECERFARHNGWKISETLTDKGRSAYAGEHLKPDAALGGFMARVQSGEIPSGSILLTERLDRLSRRPVQEAMSWIYSLTQAGIQIALADKAKVFTSDMSLEDFLVVALSLATGHEESSKKGERVSSAKRGLWELAEKREGKWTNLAARPPLWLARNEQRNGWLLDEHRAAIVRNIFQWSADGLGAVLITNRLNRLGEKPWGKWRKYDDHKWGRTAIRQLLINPAVEGDFRGESGMFEGRVIHHFYPRVVDADVVAIARSNQKARSKIAAKGKSVSVGTSNLFGGSVVCGECRQRAFLSSSVSKGKRYAYIKCEGASDGRCENKDYYPYDRFEATAMDLCLDLALDDRFFEASGDLRELRIKEAEIEKALSDKRNARQRLLSFLEIGEVDQQIENRIRALKAEIDELVVQLATNKSDAALASGKVGAMEHLRRVNDIRDAAKSDDPMVREQARSKMRLAFGAILNSVASEHDEGVKVFTVSFLAGILAVRIDTKGNILRAVSDGMGRPLGSQMEDQPVILHPLIRRIEAKLDLPNLN